jgi:hypothetical protein
MLTYQVSVPSQWFLTSGTLFTSGPVKFLVKINLACLSRSIGLLYFAELRNIFLQLSYLFFGFAGILITRFPFPSTLFKHGKLKFATDKTGVIPNDRPPDLAASSSRCTNSSPCADRERSVSDSID